MAIGLAFAGFEAFALIIPIPIVAAATAVLAWKFAGQTPRFCFSRRRSLALFKAGLPLALAQLVLLATWHGDYIIVQSLLDTSTLGLYFLAFTLSTQFFSLASRSASRVLFAGLSQLAHDPQRQTSAFFKAAGELASFAFPVSFLQILLAKPAVDLLFPERFAPMAGIISILSFGLAFRSVGSPAGALLQARREFGRLLLVNSVYSVIFLTSVYLATRAYGATGTSVAVTIYFVILGRFTSLFRFPRRGTAWLSYQTSSAVPPLVH